MSAVARWLIEPDRVGRRLGQPPGAEAAHARVELQVQRDALRKRRLRDGKLEMRVARFADLGVTRGPHDDDARIGERGPEPDAFADRGDAERTGAFLERDSGHLDGAVAVCVGLHDRPQLRPGQRIEQTAHVVPHERRGRS